MARETRVHPLSILREKDKKLNLNLRMCAVPFLSSFYINPNKKHTKPMKKAKKKVSVDKS